MTLSKFYNPKANPEEEARKKVEEKAQEDRDALIGRLMRQYGLDKISVTRLLFNLNGKADLPAGDDQFERRFHEEAQKLTGRAPQKDAAQTIPNLASNPATNRRYGSKFPKLG